jgi:Zn-dependent protease/predicted transcriptional regulator
MSWAFRVARVAEIDIKVHVTFFIILLLAAFQWGSNTGTAAGALFGVALMILLFVCITLHELGHSLVAQRFGIPVREITLLPLGGVAQLTKNPERPLHELLIAAAGPAVNIVLAAVLALIVGLNSGVLLDGQGLLPDDTTSTSFGAMARWLLAANISIVLFNLIPAFPLDGGRILRALLAMRLGMPRATRIASVIGQIIAIGLGIYGVVSGNFVLTLIAVFIFFGAGQENAVAQSKTVLTTKLIGDAYNKHALTLQTGDRVSRVVDYILTSYQPDFAVMQGDKPAGIVTRTDVLRTLSMSREDLYVGEIMNRDFARLDASTSLDAAREQLNTANTRVAAVFRGDAYLGLISQEDISEALTVLTFVQISHRR